MKSTAHAAQQHASLQRSDGKHCAARMGTCHLESVHTVWAEQKKGCLKGKGLTDGNSLLWGDVRSILEVVVLPLLLCLQVQTCQPAQVLAAHCLVHSGSTPDTLPVVVGHIGPPVRLLLHITQNHVLNGSWQPRHLHTQSKTSGRGQTSFAKVQHGIHVEPWIMSGDV